jgi:lysophospholipid acyltransferase (LPLAT)-like uncharacterized protein
MNKRLIYRLAHLLVPPLAIVLVRGSRVRRLGVERLQQLRQTRQPFLYVLWHGSMLAPIIEHRSQDVVAMVSQHGDGEVVARLLANLGYGTVRGSSGRGGREAFHGMVEELRAGRCGAVVPDGPRGPARHLKPGLIRLASRAGGVPILPVTSAASPATRLRSWDRFLIPWPASRLVIAYGDPVSVPADLDEPGIEAYRRTLETRMWELDDVAARAAGAPLLGQPRERHEHRLV